MRWIERTVSGTCLFVLFTLACFAHLPAWSKKQEHLNRLVYDSIEIPEAPNYDRRKKVGLNHIFEAENSALGHRIPMVFIPGRAQEYQWRNTWKKFMKASLDDPDFVRQYKLYFYLYDSTAELDDLSQGLADDFKHYFAELPESRPVVMITYSLGGLIAYEAMRNDDVMNRVFRHIAISVPFHGSPMFDPKWYTEDIWAQAHSPIRKFWDKMIYQAYIAGKGNLTRGMGWDNFDCSKPQYDPVEIVGDQIHTNNIEPYIPQDHTRAFKDRTWIYASYLENRFTQKGFDLNVDTVVGYSSRLPKAIIGTIIPFYLSVHSVFVYTNHQLANIPTYTPEFPKGKNTRVYRYNDGAIPLSSMLFLPPRKQPYTEDLSGLLKALDVSKLRLFRDLDHVDLGHYTFFKGRLDAPDELSPDDGERNPIEWMLYDLDQTAQDIEETYKKTTMKEQYHDSTTRLKKHKFKYYDR